jgi:hypothetical protein
MDLMRGGTDEFFLRWLLLFGYVKKAEYGVRRVRGDTFIYMH